MPYGEVVERLVGAEVAGIRTMVLEIWEDWNWEMRFLSSKMAVV